MSFTSTNLASDSWAIADLLRGDFKQSQYGRIILPFALLRRPECVLEKSKEAVLAKVEEVEAMSLPEEAAEQLLIRATNQKTSRPTTVTRNIINAFCNGPNSDTTFTRSHSQSDKIAA